MEVNNCSICVSSALKSAVSLTYNGFNAEHSHVDRDMLKAMNISRNYVCPESLEYNRLSLIVEFGSVDQHAT